jgi:hypothetical protein
MGDVLTTIVNKNELGESLDRLVSSFCNMNGLKFRVATQPTWHKYGSNTSGLRVDDFIDKGLFVNTSSNYAYLSREYDITDGKKSLGLVVYMINLNKCVAVSGEFVGLGNGEYIFSDNLTELFKLMMAYHKNSFNSVSKLSKPVSPKASVVKSYSIKDKDILSISYPSDKVGITYDENEKKYKTVRKDSINTQSDFRYVCIGDDLLHKMCGIKKDNSYRKVAICGERISNEVIGIRCPDLSNTALTNKEFISVYLLETIKHINRVIKGGGYSGDLAVTKCENGWITLNNGASIAYGRNNDIVDSNNGYILYGDYTLKELIEHIYEYARYLLFLDKNKANCLIRDSFDRFHGIEAKLTGYRQNVITKLFSTYMNKNNSPVWEFKVRQSVIKGYECTDYETTLLMEYNNGELYISSKTNDKPMELNSFIAKFRKTFGIGD